MGKFQYGDTISHDFDDRVLAHLEVVIVQKLRRNEPFLFAWNRDISLGSGRTSVWVHSHALLAFRYNGGRPPTLNRHWLEALVAAANSPQGLRVLPEPQASAVGAGLGEADLDQ
ncbi:ATP-dependent DNA ligase [Microbacterium sp. NPDC057407]|uniref:DUF7882 family protein n=1 Tax=Microbacterium sp. NPDC057407 TaxID=3346120 RepID=UPI003672763D